MKKKKISIDIMKNKLSKLDSTLKRIDTHKEYINNLSDIAVQA